MREIKYNEIQDLLIICVETAVSELSLESQFDISADTLLLAEGGAIDSLQLVSIIVDFEEAINAKFNTSISLTSDEALIQVESPFESVKTLAEYSLKVISSL